MSLCESVVVSTIHTCREFRQLERQPFALFVGNSALKEARIFNLIPKFSVFKGHTLNSP